jgi:hypothetical protein
MGSQIASCLNTAMLHPEQGLDLSLAILALCFGVVAMLIVAAVQRLVSLVRNRSGKRGTREDEEEHE